VEGVESAADGVSEVVAGSRGGGSEQSFEFGEDLLDRVEVG
jgi:hypothetical protein